MDAAATWNRRETPSVARKKHLSIQVTQPIRRPPASANVPPVP